MFTNLKKMKVALLSTLGTILLLAFLFPSMAMAANSPRYGVKVNAVVDANGILIRGSSVNSVSHLGFGRYEVFFNQPVQSCNYQATIGSPTNGFVSNPGFISTASGHMNNTYGIYVETKDMNGRLADFPFHLNAVC